MPVASDESPTGAAPLLAFGRTNQQRAIDIFRGTTDDRLGDEAFADPRETRLLKFIQLGLRVNRVIGDPLGLAAGEDQGADRVSAGAEASDHGAAPPAGDRVSTGVFDP